MIFEVVENKEKFSFVVKDASGNLIANCNNDFDSKENVVNIIEEFLNLQKHVFIVDRTANPHIHNRDINGNPIKFNPNVYFEIYPNKESGLFSWRFVNEIKNYKITSVKNYNKINIDHQIRHFFSSNCKKTFKIIQ